MDTYDFIHDLNKKIEEFVYRMDHCTPARDTIGMDSRAAYNIYINEDCIAVDKSQDRTLQYYGALEYVDKLCRYEMGDFVFYMADDDRVKTHIDRFYDREEEG